jgi:hypothetical protein
MVVGYRENIEKKGLLVAGLDLNDVQARNGAGDRTQDYEILRMDVPGCPKTGQTSGNCPGWGFRTMPISVPGHADRRFRGDRDHDSGMMAITRSGMIPIS